MRLGMVLAVLLLPVTSPPNAVGAVTGEDQYNLAANHYTDGRWDLAASEFEKLLRDHRDHSRRSEALFFRGESLLQLSRYRQAAEAFGTLLKETPDHKLAARAAFREGESYYLATDYSSAKECFDRLLAEQQQHPDASLVRAYLAGALLAIAESADRAEEEDLKRAAQLFRESLKDEGEGPLGETCRFGLARSEQLQGLGERAAAAYEQLLEANDPSLSAQSHYYLGEIESERGEHADAAQTYEALIGSAPKSRSAVAVLGPAVIEHAEAGDFAAAKKAFDRYRAQATGPPDRGVLQQTARLARQAGEVEWAIALYQILSETAAEPDAGAAALEKIVQTQIESDQHADAEQTLKKLVAATSDACRKAEATFQLANTQMRLSHNSDALKSYLKIKQEWPDCDSAIPAALQAGGLLAEAGDRKKAAELYAALIDQNLSKEEQAELLYRWAWVLADLGRTDEAGEKFARLHEQATDSPYWADATYRLAEHALEQGNPALARSFLTKLLAGNQDADLQEYALYLLSRAAGSMRDWDAAQKALQELVEQFPTSKLRNGADFSLAEAAYQAAQYELAETRFSKLAKADYDRTEAATVRLRRAQLFGTRGEWDAAGKIAGGLKADTLDPAQRDELHYLLGRCQIAAAEFDQARLFFRRAAQIDSETKTETAAMAQWMIGESFMHQENYQAALGEYFRVVSLYPFPRWQAAGLLQAGKCYERLSRGQDAAKLYRQIQEDYSQTEFAKTASERLKALEAVTAANKKE